MRIGTVQFAGIEKHLGQIAMRFPAIRIGHSGLLEKRARFRDISLVKLQLTPGDISVHDLILFLTLALSGSGLLKPVEVFPCPHPVALPLVSAPQGKVDFRKGGGGGLRALQMADGLIDFPPCQGNRSQLGEVLGVVLVLFHRLKESRLGGLELAALVQNLAQFEVCA